MKINSPKHAQQDLFKEELDRHLSALGFALSEQQFSQFAQYQAELLAWNTKVNLTALKEEKEIIIKHFYDSLLGLKVGAWSGQERVLDLGTGAGFPGIPLKLVSPALSLVLVDSLQKRVNFLQNLVGVLGLTEVAALHGRAEELGRDQHLRGKFDVVVSRAVAHLAVLAEYCLPFVKKGGVFLAYKGVDAQRECEEAGVALEKLGGKLLDIHRFSLPDAMGERSILRIKKVKATPITYPRRPGTPSKNPL